MTPSTVCFKAKGDSYGAFYIPTNGSIVTFKLKYLYGKVSCYKVWPVHVYSKWGCTTRLTHKMGTLITDSSKNRLLPKDKYLRGGADCGNSHFYELPWAGPNSEELRFDDFSTPLSVSVGQEFQVWFAEDFRNCDDWNNGSEETCAEVYGLYV